MTIERPSRPSWMDKAHYDTVPRSIALRPVISRKKGCRDKTLLTSLLDHGRLPNKLVRERYDRRWDVETDFRSIKDVLGAGVLACRTPERVTKELWTHLLGYRFRRVSESNRLQAGIADQLRPEQVINLCADR